jgi:hypothetical protein
MRAPWRVMTGARVTPRARRTGDGRATIDRARQQPIVVDVVLEVLRRVDAEDAGETRYTVSCAALASATSGSTRVDGRECASR